jgi:hypothetical protein
MEKTRKLKLTNHSISGTDATRQKKLPSPTKMSLVKSHQVRLSAYKRKENTKSQSYLEIYNKKEKDI